MMCAVVGVRLEYLVYYFFLHYVYEVFDAQDYKDSYNDGYNNAYANNRFLLHDYYICVSVFKVFMADR